MGWISHLGDCNGSRWSKASLSDPSTVLISIGGQINSDEHRSQRNKTSYKKFVMDLARGLTLSHREAASSTSTLTLSKT